MKPSHEECEEQFNKFRVPSNIIKHCKKVNQVAVFLANELQGKGIKVNIDLVDRLSLMHDLFKAFKIIPLTDDPKFKSFPTKQQIDFWNIMRKKYSPNMHESEVFYEEFKHIYPELAEAVKKEGEMGKTIDKSVFQIEYRIVSYADWRVFVDEIIPFEKRIDDIFERYKEKRSSQSKEFWDKFKQGEFELEHSIFKHLDFSPNELKEKVEGSGRKEKK